jgi:glycosyltransferase involved in cell wall biosynthesis
LGSLAKLIRRDRFDIIHSHSSKAGFLGRFAALVDSDARIVYSPHGFYYLNFDDPIRFNLFKYVERIHRSRTDRLITLSTGEFRKAIEDRIAEPSRAALIENGIDHADCLSRGEARARFNIAPDAVVVGTISRFTPQKAPFDLVTVARELVAADPNVVFAWLSDGEMRPQVEAAIARYGLRNNVLLPGYVDDARRLIPAFDVFVLASRWEGLPYTIMEAMDAGVAIVATDVVGTQDVIDDPRTGLLVPPGRPRELAKVVRRLLTHPDEAAKIAGAAQEEVSTRFSRVEMVRRISTLYRELAGDRVRD